MHADAARQAYLGFGVQLWYGDTGAEESIPSLAIRHARIGVRGFDRIPEEADSVEAFAAHFAASLRPESFRATHDMLARHGVEVMLNAFHLPRAWLDERKTLRGDHVERFALAWVGAVRLYDTRGARPRRLELFNEPDGDWNARCPPALYTRVVAAVRRALDAHGYGDVGIVGPGLAHIDLVKPWKTRDEWIEALDADGLAAIEGWSIHGYEWREPERNDPDYVRRQFAAGFLASIATHGDAGRKPIFMTEFGTFTKSFPSGDCVSIRDRHGGTCAEQPAWCVRVVENALSFLNGGAGALIYWELCDQSWTQTDFGLLGRRSEGHPKKMLYHAFTALFPELAGDGWNVVDVTQTEDAPLYAAALRRGNALVLAVVNRGAAERAARIAVPAAEGLRLVRVHRFLDGARETRTLERDMPPRFEFKVAPLSTLTLVAEMTP